MILSLTGFMGSGKTSAGRALQAMLGCGLMDLDEYIEAAEGRSIAEIFASEGENAFREMEWTALRQILSGRRPQNPGSPASGPAPPDAGNSLPPQETLILSLGGGTLTQSACASLIRERTVCIYLRATIDTLVRNLEQYPASRPLLQTSAPLRERISALMAERSSVYERTAHHILDVDGLSDREIAEKIIGLKIPLR